MWLQGLVISIYLVVAFSLSAEELGIPTPESDDKPKIEHNFDKLNSYGTLLLDGVSWSKVMPNTVAHTIVMICNKGAIGYNAVHDKLRDEFMSLAKKSHTQNDLLFSQIIINGAENSLLASNTFGIENPSYIKNPYFYLFMKGDDKPIALQTPNTVDKLKISDIAYFVTKNTGISFGLPGTDSIMDSIADKFMSEMANITDRHNFINEGTIYLEKTKSIQPAIDTKIINNIEFYIKIMSKIIEKGNNYADIERDRLEAILDSDKVSESRKDEFRLRVNILGSFSPPAPLIVPSALKVGSDGSPLE